jgi:hypothetical protein
MGAIVIARNTKYLYWPTTILLTLIYLVTGIGNLVPFSHIAADMTKLGYPTYILPFLGVCKLLAAGLLIFPASTHLKKYAYVGVAIDLTGAIYSRLANRDALITVVIPFLILLLAAVSWSLLPQKKESLS